jgi:5'-nucleotidase (lipoprotein e(P4) family)
MKKTIIVLFALLSLGACKNQDKGKSASQDKLTSNEHMLYAVLYHQKAAEARAIYYQTFNLAKMMFEKDYSDKSIKQKRAVIVDIDETVLDNSPYEAECILEKINYPAKWEEWCNMAKAKAIPGSVDFLNFVKDKNADVFYVTNRKENLREATEKNLKDKGFPLVDKVHVLMKTETTNKEKYRNIIGQDYHIAVLMGDNLADFTSVFEKKATDDRIRLTDSLKSVFGNKFIVLPNAMYGDWETAIYLFRKDLKASEKDSLRKSNLIGF